jgi:two-component system sensor histidine kinase PilS (NtrC family)
MTQAGLAGSGFFVITVLAGELAGRLAREELSARGSLEMARQQAQLNQLVIEEMEDGVLVVDRRGKVRAANPVGAAPARAEGISRAAPFQLRGVRRGARSSRRRARVRRGDRGPRPGRDVALQFAPDSHRTLRVRVRFTRKREPQSSEEFCVLFLEDVRNMQARSRQEKLAAMGRISAGIAHEIRNPLAAIAQANALLAEDATVDPAQRQLTRMVTENVERLKRIVDDVMEVAPGPGAAARSRSTPTRGRASAPTGRRPPASSGGAACCTSSSAGRAVGVLFDAEHLRRVLVNLLDNAPARRRQAGRDPGATSMLRPTSARLSSASERRRARSRRVEPPVRALLLVRSRGSGLGLYICRELCERHGASIDYRAAA